MNNEVLGQIVNLYVSKKGIEKRELKECLVLELDGVCEDKFKGKDIQRSVLLVSQISYKRAKDNGIELNCGDLGENILVDFDPYSLATGTQLQIGNTIVEISQKSTLCSSLSKISSKLPKLLKDTRGIFAKVISGGKVNKYDKITLI